MKKWLEDASLTSGSCLRCKCFISLPSGKVKHHPALLGASDETYTQSKRDISGSNENRGGNFRPSVGGRGSLRGDGPGRGLAGGLEHRGWGLRRVSMGPGGWGLEGADRTDARSLGRTEIPPLFYRTSSPLGPLPKKLLKHMSI